MRISFACIAAAALSSVLLLQVCEGIHAQLKNNEEKDDTDAEETLENIQYASRKWTLVKLNEAEYPRARCLDGSMAGYW
jgi:hypothetical protein